MQKQYVDKINHLIEKFENIKTTSDSLLMLHLIILQSEEIEMTLNKLENAISFARLHLLHEDIIPLKNLTYVLSNNNWKPFKHITDFYSLCPTKVIIGKDQLLFLVTVPILNFKEYDLFHLHNLPFRNTFIPSTQPYVLVQEEIIKWELREIYLIEDFYIAKQENLTPSSTYLEYLFKKLEENCTRVPTPMVTDLYQLEDRSIVSQNNTWIFEHCQDSVKRLKVPTMSILKGSCMITNSKKSIYPINTVELRTIIELLPLNMTTIQEIPEEKLQVEEIPTLKDLYQ
ncbi:hypothetical protein HHI36_008060 [Cryptolaemus montrouzieri]|uniref:Uncharacterized protein n=1 Tax=Cryptolaemus montrouzieri TaxID=559131 RepID=A0ABD2MRB3_9CUCU